MSTSQKTKIAPEPTLAKITGLSHDGRGIAHINGKTTFIENALPDEEVAFVYLRRHNKYDEGKTVEVKQASPSRVTPLCEHFTICGGCALQHMDSETQIQLKQKMLLEQLQHFGGVIPESILPPLTGNLWGYRRKARLGVKYVAKKQRVLVGFREKNGRYLADLERCVVLHPSVGNLITALKELVQSLTIYQQIPQIEVGVTDDTTALIFRHMQPVVESDLNLLVEFSKTHNIDLYLQPGAPSSAHLVWPENKPPRLFYQLPEYNLELGFFPTDFTQINASINQQMLARALQLLEPKAEDRILDLFCGIGNFTLPLARYCKEVIGVEGAAESIDRAKENAAHNNVTNAHFYHADLNTDFTQALWAQGNFTGILLDPPRTGALNIVQHIAKFNAKRIVYVSCNPATLARDAKELVEQGYRLKQAGIMDMFPHTHHVEAIALFVRER